MKKSISIIVLFLLPLFNFAQTIEGNWNAALEVQGTKLPLVFHIENKAGKLSSTMDSPMQKAFGIPMTTTTFLNNELTIETPSFTIKYTGKPNADFSEIDGTFKQSGAEYPLKLNKKAFEKVVLNRPQTPKPPFAYNEEEVAFQNKKDNITLAGTLTYPKTGGKFPVVILITGSGAQDRNEEIFEHKPFAVIADELTKKGIAVLRFDDRGVGKSTGSYQNSITTDFATDVLSAIDFLKTRTEINPKKIGLIGHSEGGMVAPIVAAQSKDVAFIVLMAGPGIPNSELMVAQNAASLKLAGADETQIKESADLNNTIYTFIKNNDSGDLESKLTALIKSELAKTQNENAALTDDKKDEIAHQLAQQTLNKWFQYFVRYVPSENLSKIKCPVLAINGSLDFQVGAKTNLKAIGEALTKAKNKNFKVVELPGLNHLFQEATTGALEEYSKIEQTISPKALAVMSDWIVQQVK